MAVVKLSQLAAIEIVDSDSNGSVEAMSTTDATTAYALEIDNRNNTVASFTRLWAKSSAPTIGTHDPDFMFKTPAGKLNFLVLGTDLAGIAAAAGCDWYAVTTTSSAGSSTTSPAKKVRVTLWTAAV